MYLAHCLFYKVLLAHSHTHSLIIHGCFYPTMAELSNRNKDGVVHTPICPFLPYLCLKAPADSISQVPLPAAPSWAWSTGRTCRKSESGRRKSPEYFFPASSHLRWYDHGSFQMAPPPHCQFSLGSHNAIYAHSRGWNGFLLWLISRDLTHHPLSILVTLTIFQSFCPSPWII